MAQVCEICGKRHLTGCNVSHAHNKTKRRFKVNLQSVRTPKGRMKICTRCLRSGLVEKRIS